LAETRKISKRINLNRKIRIGSKTLTVLEYLKDTNYPPDVVRIMADEGCDAVEAINILKNSSNK